MDLGFGSFELFCVSFWLISVVSVCIGELGLLFIIMAAGLIGTKSLFKQTLVLIINDFENIFYKKIFF